MAMMATWTPPRYIACDALMPVALASGGCAGLALPERMPADGRDVTTSLVAFD